MTGYILYANFAPPQNHKITAVYLPLMDGPYKFPMWVSSCCVSLLRGPCLICGGSPLHYRWLNEVLPLPQGIS